MEGLIGQADWSDNGTSPTNTTPSGSSVYEAQRNVLISLANASTTDKFTVADAKKLNTQLMNLQQPSLSGDEKVDQQKLIDLGKRILEARHGDGSGSTTFRAYANPDLTDAEFDNNLKTLLGASLTADRYAANGLYHQSSGSDQATVRSSTFADDSLMRELDKSLGLTW